ncbi:MAG: hypothetical protein EA376_09075 [Phycisphaeraceae bacterium]|nr:MAG: hypothetical protein EA376_09075 [Phycisphaeraceae bacterium]
MDGLRRADVCPECAIPAEWSLGADLRRADRGWLARITRGAAIMNGAYIGLLLLILVGIGALLLNQYVFMATPAEEAVFFPVAAVFLIVANLWLIGWRLVATPDPGRDVGGLERSRARSIIRGVVVVAIVAQLGFVAGWIASAIALGVRGASSGAIVAGVAATMLLCAASLLLCAVFVYYASLMLTRRLARRIPSPQLVKRSVRIMWHIPLAIAVGAAVIWSIAVFVPAFDATWIAATIVIGIAGWWMGAHLMVYAPLQRGLRAALQDVSRGADAA